MLYIKFVDPRILSLLNWERARRVSCTLKMSLCEVQNLQSGNPPLTLSGKEKKTGNWKKEEKKKSMNPRFALMSDILTVGDSHKKWVRMRILIWNARPIISQLLGEIPYPANSFTAFLCRFFSNFFPQVYEVNHRKTIVQRWEITVWGLLPDRAFHNFRASKSEHWRLWNTHKIDWFRVSKKMCNVLFGM